MHRRLRVGGGTSSGLARFGDIRHTFAQTRNKQFAYEQDMPADKLRAAGIQYAQGTYTSTLYLAIQCRAPAGSHQRHARNNTTTTTTTTTGQAGSFARGITWARARRRAKRRKCTTAPNQLATPATSVETLTCGDSQTCAMTALGYTPFASTGATPNQVTASAASVSCVSSAGKAETMGQL